MKKKKLLLQTIIIVVLAFGLFFAMNLFTSDPYQKRLNFTVSSLNGIRNNIEVFNKEQNRYPNSLKELKDHNSGDASGEYNNWEYKEYISNETGKNQESHVLNGEGGWYYNPENGEVKINITQPLKYYFKKDIRIFRRNKIPSEW